MGIIFSKYFLINKLKLILCFLKIIYRWAKKTKIILLHNAKRIT